MSFDKRKLQMNVFCISYFKYCPLICMCHSRTNNRKIKILHEICSEIIYNDQQSSFNALLNKCSSVSIHIRNIQRLAIEMMNFYTGLSPAIMENVFKLKIPAT